MQRQNEWVAQCVALRLIPLEWSRVKPGTPDGDGGDLNAAGFAQSSAVAVLSSCFAKAHTEPSSQYDFADRRDTAEGQRSKQRGDEHDGIEFG